MKKPNQNPQQAKFKEKRLHFLHTPNKVDNNSNPAELTEPHVIFSHVHELPVRFRLMFSLIGNTRRSVFVKTRVTVPKAYSPRFGGIRTYGTAKELMNLADEAAGVLRTGVCTSFVQVSINRSFWFCF